MPHGSCGGVRDERGSVRVQAGEMGRETKDSSCLGSWTGVRERRAVWECISWGGWSGECHS